MDTTSRDDLAAMTSAVLATLTRMKTASQNFEIRLRDLHSLAVLILIAGLATFVIRMVQNRRRFRRMLHDGLPMPPHSFLFGHLLVVAKVYRRLPPDAHPFYLADQLRRQYPNLDTAFYIDLWPFNESILMVTSPQAMAAFTQQGYLPKHPINRRFMEPLTGEQDLVSMDGPLWKHWRSVFNAGFSHSNVLSMVPSILDEVMIFERLLEVQSQREDIFQLEKLTRNLSFDVIGRVVMNHRFHCQTSHNLLTTAMQEQIELCSCSVGQGFIQRLNPLRHFFHHLNTWRINEYLRNYWLNMQHNSTGTVIDRRSVIQLAISALASEHKQADTDTGHRGQLEQQIMCHVKTFLVAGHDTVATSVCFVLHTLYNYRDVLQQTREEHDAVLGKDITDTPLVIASQPHLLSKLPITLSVIKESLRIYPATSTARAGQPGFNITDEDGRSFPTEGFLVWGNHHGLHYNPRFWAQADKFLPERYRVSEGDVLSPPKDAWRPFEKGTRACLGQDLALTEMLIVIVIVLRKYDIRSAYAEWDALQLQANGMQIDGRRLYQCLRGGGYPSDHYPCIARRNE